MSFFKNMGGSFRHILREANSMMNGRMVCPTKEFLILVSFLCIVFLIFKFSSCFWGGCCVFWFLFFRWNKIFLLWKKKKKNLRWIHCFFLFLFFFFFGVCVWGCRSVVVHLCFFLKLAFFIESENPNIFFILISRFT